MALRPLPLALAALALLSGCRSDAPQRAQAHAAITVVGTRAAAPIPSLPPSHVAAATDANDVSTLTTRLAAIAPGLDPQVIELALRARGCALSHSDEGGDVRDGRLAVIDYSLPSTERRLWVFDLAARRLLYREYVAHGRNTGDNLARHFSNDDGSFESSLGLFRTAETYDGHNGYSLRMDGLDPGFNDHARQRAIVMHGAWYVNASQAAKQGRLGRSQGCPALRPEVAHAVIDTLKQGQMLFAYYPDRDWLQHSRLLACGGATATATEPAGSRIHIAAR